MTISSMIRSFTSDEQRKAVMSKLAKAGKIINIRAEKAGGDWLITRKKGEDQADITEYFERTKRKVIRLYSRGPKNIYIRFNNRIIHCKSQEDALKRIGNIMTGVNVGIIGKE
jgi:hypothetical protein